MSAQTVYMKLLYYNEIDFNLVNNIVNRTSARGICYFLDH